MGQKKLNSKGKKIVVIGSGFSGLSAACYLAAEGFDVTVLEKNDSPGGRARKFESDGFVFDMGPSWYWMPDVFESFFAHFGKNVADYYHLVRLDPSYQVIFGKNDTLDLPAKMEQIEQLFEQIEPGSTPNLRRFLKEAEYKYRAGMGIFVKKPGLSWLEFADWRVISSAFRLHMFTSVARHIRKLFRHEKLRKILEFPVLFLGATPERTPALYSLMNHADLSLGTWYPMGGMSRIVDAMTELAASLGVQFSFSKEAIKIVVENAVATQVVCRDGSIFQADHVVAAADYHHVENELLTHDTRNYPESYWNSRTMAPSCLIWYLGIDKKLAGLKHHNLFFDEDFSLHAREIYDHPQWPSKPLFYLCAPSTTDPEIAPDNHENLFLLIPVAPGLEDTPEMREKYFNLVMNRLELLTNQKVREHVIFNRSYAHSDFINDYHSFKGNAYGLANTLRQTAVLKPSLKSRKVKNLWYAGQLTTPGPGVPPAIISGEVVAKEILGDERLTSTD